MSEKVDGRNCMFTKIAQCDDVIICVCQRNMRLMRWSFRLMFDWKCVPFPGGSAICGLGGGLWPLLRSLWAVLGHTFGLCCWSWAALGGYVLDLGASVLLVLGRSWGLCSRSWGLCSAKRAPRTPQERPRAAKSAPAARPAPCSRENRSWPDGGAFSSTRVPDPDPNARSKRTPTAEDPEPLIWV